MVHQRSKFFLVAMIFFSMLFVGQAFAQNMNDILTYLKMEAISQDGKVLDFSGQYDAVVFAGNPSVVVGQVGNALEFHGFPDHLRLPQMLLSNAQEITIEYWVKFSTQDFDWAICGFLTSYDRYQSYAIRLGVYESQVAFANPGTWTDWSGSYDDFPTTNQWYHYAMTIRAGQKATIYINGNKKYEIENGVPPVFQNIPVFGIGASVEGPDQQATHWFDSGAIDEFAIFNRVLSDEEIQTHYQNGLMGMGYEGVQGPVYAPSGFESPMANVPVKVVKKRVLPIKTQLLNSEGQYITNQDIPESFPVIQVLYYASILSDPVNVSEQALAEGQGTEGNQFTFTTEGKWQFNLNTANYTAEGIYTIKITSGDPTKYTIDEDSYTPAVFIIE